MSFTDTEKHWLWGCAAATETSRSDVNVAMPHLRGKWSPTNAISRTLELSFMRQSFIPRAPRCYAHESARQPQMCRLSVNGEGAFSDSGDSVLRTVVSKACASNDTMRAGRSDDRMFAQIQRSSACAHDANT